MAKKMMFEEPESKRDEMKEDRQKVKAVEKIATTKVREHERKMHKKMASGGMVARGGGAAKKGLKFTRNG